MNVYCHADAAEQARWFGDDIAFKGDGFEHARHEHRPGCSASSCAGSARTARRCRRARRLAPFPVTGQKLLEEFFTTHSTLGAQFAERVGLDDGVARGDPARVRAVGRQGPRAGCAAPEICAAGAAGPAGRADGGVQPPPRHRLGAGSGPAPPGDHFDPDVADLFCAHAPDLLDGLDEAAGWDAVLAAEPSLSRGRGRGRAGRRAGGDGRPGRPQVAVPGRPFARRGQPGRGGGPALRPADVDVTAVRRAGLVHDLGRLGVSNAVWDKPGPLTAAEFERVRLHPYLTDRMLARVPALARSRQIAARHHERLDGSGYPHGLTAASLSPLDRLLAAADVTTR